MTYNDIYKNFLIEYDKANVSSSYPSLLPEEIYELLNKAMLAWIAQHVTGNNYRRTVLDSDTKSANNLWWLMSTSTANNPKQGTANNEVVYTLNTTYLYVLRCSGEFTSHDEKSNYTIIPIYSSEEAARFKQTGSNMPWVKNAIAYLKDKTSICVLIDAYTATHTKISGTDDDYYDAVGLAPDKLTVDIIRKPTLFSSTSVSQAANTTPEDVAEEIINLAIIFACKTVEQPRITTEIQTKSLES